MRRKALNQKNEKGSCLRVLNCFLPLGRMELSFPVCFSCFVLFCVSPCLVLSVASWRSVNLAVFFFIVRMEISLFLWYIYIYIFLFYFFKIYLFIYLFFPQGGMELLRIKLAFPHRKKGLKCTREQFPLKNKFPNRKMQEINFVQIKYLLYHLKAFEA